MRRTRNRLHPLEPAGSGIPDGKGRSYYDLRYELRSPGHVSSFHAGGSGSELGCGRSAAQSSRTKEGDTGTNRACMVAGAEAVDRSDPWHAEAGTTRREPRSRQRRTYVGGPARDRHRLLKDQGPRSAASRKAHELDRRRSIACSVGITRLLTVFEKEKLCRNANLEKAILKFRQLG